MKAFRSIKVQIFAVIASLGFVTALSIGVFAPSRAIRLSQEVFDHDAQLITSLLARNLAPAVAAGDSDLEDNLRRNLAALQTVSGELESPISDLEVFNQNGRLLASTSDADRTEHLNASANSISVVESDNLVQVSAPLIDADVGSVGWIRVVFSKSNLRQEAAADTRFALLWALIALVVTSAIGYFLSRRIVSPIEQVARAAENLAEGDFEQELHISAKNEIGALAAAFGRLTGYMRDMTTAARAIANNDLTGAVRPRGKKDALGKAFNIMVHNLNSVIVQLSVNAENLGKSADQINNLSDNLLTGSQSQQAQIEQVSTAIQQMAATVVESSRHAGEAAGASEQAAGTAGTGGQVVDDTAHAMERIAEVVTAVSHSIGDLSESAAQIGGIVNVIDEVADQTNLLALNAAIEAARAGEQGRGFAVVADEVRKLADRTGRATAEISGMIKTIQQKTDGVVTTMEESLGEVKQGQEMAHRASASLTEIVAMASQVTDMITQIATATDEQSAVAEQISQNAEQISMVTRNTSEAAQQSADAAAGLNDQAAGLRRLVARFRLPQYK